MLILCCVVLWSSMLTVDPEARLTVEAALRHPWLEAVAGVYPETALNGHGAPATVRYRLTHDVDIAIVD